MTKSMSVFYSIRDVKAFKKKPSTSELIDWIQLLLVAGVTHDGDRGSCGFKRITTDLESTENPFDPYQSV